MRGYYAEGEVLAGSPGESLFTAPDQLGSVRRVFASGAGGSPSYGYDPYGVPLQTTPTLTDFGFAQLFASHESGLNLTWFRAYDPMAGRWLSRDPVGEGSDPSANLYNYVSGSPLNFLDPRGTTIVSIGWQLELTPGIGFGFGFGIDLSFPTPWDPDAHFDVGLSGTVSGRVGLNAGLSVLSYQSSGELCNFSKASIDFGGGVDFGPASIGAGVYRPIERGGSLGPTSYNLGAGPSASIPIGGRVGVSGGLNFGAGVSLREILR